MDIYVLDSNFKRIRLVENYESFIWAERYSRTGDFVLTLTAEQVSQIKNARYLGTNQTSYVATLDKFLKFEDEDDGFEEKYRITGAFLEDFFKNRGNRVGLSSDEIVVYEDFPVNFLYDLVHDICRLNGTVPEDNITQLQAGTITPDMPDIPDAEAAIALKFDTLYNTIKMICDQKNMGFRLIRDGDTGQLYFELYIGVNRTNAVYFSDRIDNVFNSRRYRSLTDNKNVAYVSAPNGTRIVGAADQDGFNRRVLVVDASDILIDDDTLLQDALERRGLEALAKNRSVSMLDLDGAYTSYIYGRDYRLGDLVGYIDEDGVSTIMRVVEHIYISDKTGEHSYPTLTSDFVTSSSGGGEEPGDPVPTDILLDSDTYTRDVPDGLVGVLSTVDAGGGAHVYTLVMGAGDDDNAGFAIVDDELRTSATTPAGPYNHSVRIRSTNSVGAWFEKQFTVYGLFS